MEKWIPPIVFYFIIGFSNSYSQKIEIPEKVTIADFSTKGDKSVCLWYGSEYSFPYEYSDKICGAWDYLFSLRNETDMRILLNKNDTNFKFFALHKSINIIPKLKSIECYYLIDNKITSRSKSIESVLIINYYENGYYLDLSSLQDLELNVIVDLKFTYTTKSKKEISIYLDRNQDYKNVYFKIDIPEIYKYNVSYDDALLSQEIQKPKAGPTIGWSLQSIHVTGARFVSYNLFEQMARLPDFPDGKKNNNLRVPKIPFKCNVQSYIFKSIKFIDHQSHSFIESNISVVSFQLKEIHEITK